MIHAFIPDLLHQDVELAQRIGKEGRVVGEGDDPDG